MSGSDRHVSLRSNYQIIEKGALITSGKSSPRTSFLITITFSALKIFEAQLDTLKILMVLFQCEQTIGIMSDYAEFLRSSTVNIGLSCGCVVSRCLVHFREVDAATSTVPPTAGQEPQPSSSRAPPLPTNNQQPSSSRVPPAAPPPSGQATSTTARANSSTPAYRQQFPNTQLLPQDNEQSATRGLPPIL